jgi:hypothetical protein
MAGNKKKNTGNWQDDDDWLDGEDAGSEKKSEAPGERISSLPGLAELREDFPIEFRFGKSRKSAVCSSLNLRGMFISTRYVVPVDKKVSILIWLLGATEGLTVKGTVRWNTKSGFGVQFDRLAKPQLHTLMGCIGAAERAGAALKW